MSRFEVITKHYGRGPALVLSDNTHNARLDRKALKELLFPRIVLLTEGESALQYLRGTETCFIFVDSTLEDMQGYEFVAKARDQELASNSPVVLVSNDNSHDSVLKGISAGCSGYILRPYSIDIFEKHLHTVLNSVKYGNQATAQLRAAEALAQQGKYDEAIKSYKTVTDMKNKAQQFFDTGTKFLVAKELDKAIICFNTSLKYNKMFAEAHTGLAKALESSGDEEGAQRHLKQAASIFAAQNKLEEAKKIFVQVLEKDPNAMNPYNTIGMQLRKKGDYKAALHAYFQGQKLSPDDENLLFNIGNCYLFMKNRPKCQEYIEQVLRVNPTHERAKVLYGKLTGTS